MYTQREEKNVLDQKKKEKKKYKEINSLCEMYCVVGKKSSLTHTQEIMKPYIRNT